MKKILACFMVAMLIAFCTYDTYAQASPTKEEMDIVDAKRSLVEEHSDEYIAGLSDTVEGQERSARIAELINKMQTNIVEEQKACDELEEFGVYKLDMESEQNEVSLLKTEAADVILNKVTFFYDSSANEWYVCGGGYWGNNDWVSEIPSVVPLVGEQFPIGGYDALGVKLYNTSGVYNTYIKRSYLYYSDGVDDFQNNNPCTIDGRYGACFEFQDYALCVSSGIIANFRYVGKHFAVTLVYDGNFSNYNGYASTYYTHTWAETGVTGATIGLIGDPSFNMEYTVNKDNKFNSCATGESTF